MILPGSLTLSIGGFRVRVPLRKIRTRISLAYELVWLAWEMHKEKIKVRQDHPSTGSFFTTFRRSLWQLKIKTNRIRHQNQTAINLEQQIQKTLISQIKRVKLVNKVINLKEANKTFLHQDQ